MFRYLLVSGVVLGLAVSAFVVRIDGRTVYGHLRQLGQGRFENVLAEIHAGLDDRLRQFREIVDRSAKKRSAPKKAAPVKTAPPPAEKRREAGIERLRQAAEKTGPRTTQGTPALATKKSTRVGDKVSPAEEKALERLLTTRVSR